MTIAKPTESRPNRHDTLVFLVFESGTFTYTQDFRCVVEGALWPRELKAAWEIVAIYKEQNKASNQGAKS